MESQVPEVDTWLRSLFGTTSLPERGVLHVVSVATSRHVIAIGPEAPKSEGDFFVLNLARACADAVLTTGSIVRHEPAYHLGLQGPQAEALARYRQALGKPKPPLCALLTRDGELPREHPIWHDGTEKLVLTSPEHADALRWSGATVLGVPSLDTRRAVEVLKERGLHRISIEAGPSANALLYEPPALVDELWLSIYEGPPVPLGGALTPRLLDGLKLASEAAREEASGHWRYQRWLRG